MMDRCRNPKAKAYPDYGGRGIQVCPQWIEAFDQFLSDMGQRPKGRTLDRIDVNGHYTPGNCRWATKGQQRANRRDSRVQIVDFNLTKKQWAEQFTKSSGRRWTQKGLQAVLQYLTMEQIFAALHDCQRTPRELVLESGRRQEAAKLQAERDAKIQEYWTRPPTAAKPVTKSVHKPLPTPVLQTAPVSQSIRIPYFEAEESEADVTFEANPAPYVASNYIPPPSRKALAREQAQRDQELEAS
jgi:hypothetical protein